MIPALRSLRAWRVASRPERDEAILEAARRLGRPFEVDQGFVGGYALGTLSRTDEPGLTFVVVPGGRYSMGLSERDLEELAELVNWTRDVRLIVTQMKRRCRPVVAVRVRPFVTAERLLRRDEVERWTTAQGRPIRSDEMRRDAAVALMPFIGARMPSEVELEWLGRGGTGNAFIYDCARAYNEGRAFDEPGAFGIRDLLLGEWAADDWFPSHRGRDASSAPRRGGRDCGVFRGELSIVPVQDDFELCFGLAAHRNRGGEGDHVTFRARPTYDLP